VTEKKIRYINSLREAIGLPSIGMGSGDALSRKLMRRPGFHGTGSPRRQVADDEFAGTYLSRVTSKNEPPVKLVSFFPDQFDEEDIEEYEEEPLRTRKINPSKRIIRMREDSQGDNEMEKYSVVSALYPEDNQLNEKEEERDQREQPDGFKFRELLGLDDDEEEFDNPDSDEYAMSYDVSGGKVVSHRRPKNETLDVLRDVIREVISLRIFEDESAANDIIEDDEEENILKGDTEEEVDEISTVASIGGGPMVGLGRGPTHPAKDARGRKKQSSKKVSSPYGK
tara:strand:- start:139 stop:987 length:849 start_codon:yes stop_codon:yes gene_type:complete